MLFPWPSLQQKDARMSALTFAPHNEGKLMTTEGSMTRKIAFISLALVLFAVFAMETVSARSPDAETFVRSAESMAWMSGGTRDQALRMQDVARVFEMAEIIRQDHARLTQQMEEFNQLGGSKDANQRARFIRANNTIRSNHTDILNHHARLLRQQ